MSMTKPIDDDTTWRASPAAHAALHLELAQLAAEEAEALRSVDDWPGEPEAPELTPHEQDQLDALADNYSVELRAEYDEDAARWGIWYWDPAEGETEQSSDLVASGETVYQAIDEARDALRLWEQGKVSL